MIFRPRSLRHLVGVIVSVVAVAAASIAGCAGRSIVAPPESGVQSRSSSSGTYQLVYSFQGGSDGIEPGAPLVSLSGTLYGTTRGGGANGVGTVYSVTPAGAENVIHSFGASGDGESPGSGLAILAGTLYGTASLDAVNACGVVYSITPAGVETPLHTFSGSPDGCRPESPVAPVGGTLFGMTQSGGKPLQFGVLYKVTTAGVEHVVHAFGGTPSDGAYPTSSLLNVSGTIYGTTDAGGTSGMGTVFTRAQGGAVSVIYSFKGGTDGANPLGGLVNLNGTFYGTTSRGGASGYGTVYSITPAGAHNVVYSFTGTNGDGVNPIGNLAVQNGVLFGVTSAGGASLDGIAYSMTAGGVETIVHTFTGGSADGDNPQAGLIVARGKIYGTTAFGGAQGMGTVFHL
ncbi:MAG TPA: choice-of-anchor tandem repeat GloVer-containing protein [Candidatus Eremiobacteraceae bacterium]|jgi:uncharacterized repeat protein (TIGR03803 family)